MGRLCIQQAYLQTFSLKAPGVPWGYMACKLLPSADEELMNRGLHQFASLKDVTQGFGKEARMVFAKELQKMPLLGEEEAEVLVSVLDDSDSNLVSLLKDCSTQKNLYKGSRLHAHILKRGLLKQSIFIGSTLVSMYAKCGAIASAQRVFDELPDANIVSWNALISGYSQQGLAQQALNCLEHMQGEGLSPNAVTFLCILKACGIIGEAKKGEEIHAGIIRSGLLGKSNMLDTALMDMYAKCGALGKAQQLFEELSARDVVSWTVLIAGHAQFGHGEEALRCFKLMQDEGVSPNAVTLSSILKACGSIGAVEKGKEVYGEISRKGLLVKDSVLGTALLDMCAKCGALLEAQQVFDELPARDVVSWNALLAGYCQHGNGEEALNCYEQMQQEALSPDAVTFACILKACGSIGAAEKGEDIHFEIVRKGFMGKNTMLSNALVDMYAKCGALAKAQEVFDELPVRNIVSWNALIAGYCQYRHSKEALTCFERMKHEGLSPDEVTFSCMLRACSSIGAAEKGAEIHAEIIREGFLGRVTNLRSALLDMYINCGALAKAQEVFDNLPVRDVVTWTALMSGFAQAGKHKSVFDSFNKMVEEGTEPSLVTFVVLLNACSYLGLVDEAQRYFNTMTTSYGITPSLEHHTCMVDLFSRIGHFDKAVAELKKMPSSHHFPVWSALLGACRKWGNVNLAKLAFEHAVQLDVKSAVAYLCMSNIYAAAGMQDDVNMIESRSVMNEAWMKTGGFGVDQAQ